MKLNYIILGLLMLTIFVSAKTLIVPISDFTAKYNTSMEAESLCHHLNVSNENLIMYLNADCDTSTARDLTNYENNGTIKNGNVINYGVIGKGYNLSVNTAEIMINDTASMSPENITFCFWVNITAGNPDSGYLTMGKKYEAYSFQTFNNNNVGFEIRSDNSNYYNAQDSSTTLTGEEGNWNFYCGRYNGTHVTIFRNGEAKASTARTGTIDDSASPLYMGHRPSETGAMGIYDEIQIYNTPLSDEDITSLYGSSYGRFYDSGLIQFDSLDLNDTDDTNTNITLTNCYTNNESVLEGALGIGSFFNFTDCVISEYDLLDDIGDTNNISFYLRYTASPNSFYTSMAIENITFDTYGGITTTTTTTTTLAMSIDLITPENAGTVYGFDDVLHNFSLSGGIEPYTKAELYLNTSNAESIEELTEYVVNASVNDATPACWGDVEATWYNSTHIFVDYNCKPSGVDQRCWTWFSNETKDFVDGVDHVICENSSWPKGGGAAVIKDQIIHYFSEQYEIGDGENRQFIYMNVSEDGTWDCGNPQHLGYNIATGFIEDAAVVADVWTNSTTNCGLVTWYNQTGSVAYAFDLCKNGTMGDPRQYELFNLTNSHIDRINLVGDIGNRVALYRSHGTYPGTFNMSVRLENESYQNEYVVIEDVFTSHNLGDIMIKNDKYIILAHNNTGASGYPQIYSSSSPQSGYVSRTIRSTSESLRLGGLFDLNPTQFILFLPEGTDTIYALTYDAFNYTAAGSGWELVETLDSPSTNYNTIMHNYTEAGDYSWLINLTDGNSPEAYKESDSIMFTLAASTTTTTIPIHILGFSADNDYVIQGTNIELTLNAEISTNTEIDMVWFKANTTIMNLTSGSNGTNMMLWTNTTYYEGNYSLYGYANDTDSVEATSSEIWVTFFITTTTTTTITTTTTTDTTTTTIATTTTGTTTTSTATTTTLNPAYAKMLNGSYLDMPLTFWESQMPSGYGWIPLLIFIALTYIMLWIKLGNMVVPTLLLLVVLAVGSSWFGVGIFAGMGIAGGLVVAVFVGMMLMVLYKIFT